MHVAETGSISSSIAGRYATALFDLARGEGKIEALERDTETLAQALDASADLRSLFASPVYGRDDQDRAVAALAPKLGLDAPTTNTLRLMASKRRLFVLPQLVRALRARIADEKGEITAEVTSAQPLSDAQHKAMADMLGRQTGRDVRLNTTVDESLIGGLIVKVGSRMIDTSIRARLAALRNTMKEVG